MKILLWTLFSFQIATTGALVDVSSCAAVGISAEPQVGTPHSCYWVQASEYKLFPAMSACVAMDGFAAHLFSADIAAFLRHNLISPLKSYWIGLFKKQGEWRFFLSPQAELTSEVHVQFSNANATEICAVINNESISIVNCFEKLFPVICQKDRPRAKYQLVKGQRIGDGNAISTSKMSNAWYCGLQCERNHFCLAYIFYVDTNICQLIDRKPADYPDFFSPETSPSVEFYVRIV